jgi:hypothetical protein
VSRLDQKPSLVRGALRYYGPAGRLIECAEYADRYIGLSPGPGTATKQNDGKQNTAKESAHGLKSFLYWMAHLCAHEV